MIYINSELSILINIVFDWLLGGNIASESASVPQIPPIVVASYLLTDHVYHSKHCGYEHIFVHSSCAGEFLLLEELFEILNQTELSWIYLHSWNKRWLLCRNEEVSSSVIPVVCVQIFPSELDLVSS